MKKIFILLIAFLIVPDSYGQAKMDLEGSIRIADDDSENPEPGTIRYNPATNDFEGWNGKWVSLTKSQSSPYGSVTDIDGNQYLTVQIGSHIWMRENLRTTRYNNGDPILEANLNGLWSGVAIGAWCWYNNDPANDPLYGKLYNGYAAVDNRNVCPSGWHVASSPDVIELSDYLGGQLAAGGKMKTVADSLWMSPNEGATNESGFTGLPGGYRTDTGNFNEKGTDGVWWTSSFAANDNHWQYGMIYLNTTLGRNGEDPGFGFYIRCVKD